MRSYFQRPCTIGSHFANFSGPFLPGHELQPWAGTAAEHLSQSALVNVKFSVPATLAPSRLGRPYAGLTYSPQLFVAGTAARHLLRLAEQAQLPRPRKQFYWAGAHRSPTEPRPALHTCCEHEKLRPRPEPNSQPVERIPPRSVYGANALNSGEFNRLSGPTIQHRCEYWHRRSDLGGRGWSKRCFLIPSWHGPVRCPYGCQCRPRWTYSNTCATWNPRSTLSYSLLKVVPAPRNSWPRGASEALAARAAGAQDAELTQHSLASTARPLKPARVFGIPKTTACRVWIWVGGRFFNCGQLLDFSTLSAIGLDAFTALLGGAEDMDRHFVEATARTNLPMRMSCLESGTANFFKAGQPCGCCPTTRAWSAADFLQQLTMESNGKGVSRMGEAWVYDTAPVLPWGGGHHGPATRSTAFCYNHGITLCPRTIILAPSPRTR